MFVLLQETLFSYFWVESKAVPMKIRKVDIYLKGSWWPSMGAIEVKRLDYDAKSSPLLCLLLCVYPPIRG